MKTIISLRDVSWKRSGKEILKNINWEMKQGEHWAILGLNGSGKTSLLNIIHAYHFPSSGQVSVLDYQFGKTYLPNMRKEIGYVSNTIERFSPKLEYETVEEIIVSGKFASIGIYEEVTDEDWVRANELLKMLRLTYLKGKPFGLLSQGERRRILIARALMSNPKIFILDEPCSGLDVLSREEVLYLMTFIRSESCHLLYVTHHIEEITESITHVLLLADGEIVGVGPKKEVLSNDILSKAYKIPVQVNWKENRPWLTIKKDELTERFNQAFQ